MTITLVVTDTGVTDLASARVTISANYQNGQDFLTFTNTAHITGNFDTTTGVLTLTGSDTVADYQAALRAVMYHTNQAPNANPRTMSFVVNDGTTDSNSAPRIVDVTPVNNPPQLSAIETTPLDVKPGQAATIITSSLLLVDPDDDNLTGATVTITGHYQNGQDVLAFVNTPKITGTFNATTGTLTLSGTDTVTDYRNALQTVTYHDTSANPSPLTRTISFQATDGHASSADGNVVTRDVDITPVLSGIETTPLGYAANNDSTSNRPKTPLTATLDVSDTAGNMITGATVQITGSYQQGQDVLAFTNASGITGTFDATTGKLTLTGAATAAEYQAALRTVTYQNTSASISGQTRTVTISVVDSSTAASNSVTRNINVTSSTVVSGLETTPLSYAPGGAAIHVTSALTLTDPNGTNVSGATVKISTGLQTGDVLAFTNTAKITGTYDATTGTLTLTGSDTLANYQAALRSVTFQNTTNNASTQTRTISFRVGTTLPTTAVTRNVDISPVLTGIETTPLSYAANNDSTSNRPKTPVTATLVVSDAAGNMISGATVQITGAYQQGQDVLAFTNASGITGTLLDATTGKLTLTGAATAAEYQAALRTVTYQNTSASISGQTRTVTITVVDSSTAASNSVTRDINATTSSTVVSGLETTPLAYTQGGAAIPVTSGLTLTDPNGTNVSGATVKISSGLQTGDVLAFTNTAKITGTYDATTGTLTLTGSDTLANYQAALRSGVTCSRTRQTTRAPRPARSVSRSEHRGRRRP